MSKKHPNKTNYKTIQISKIFFLKEKFAAKLFFGFQKKKVSLKKNANFRKSPIQLLTTCLPYLSFPIILKQS